MKAENPYDIFNAFRANGASIHAKACFSREDGNEKTGKPLAAFNHFSRVVVTIIDKDEKAKYVEANIQYEKLAEIEARGRYALNLYLEKERNPVMETAGDSSPAYTVTIKSGKLSGKTPAQVLQEPDGQKLLNAQYQWLADNLAKYPKNKEQMDAIMDAARLKKEGKLKTGLPVSSGIFTILEAVPLPLIRKKKADGTCPVREISINCNLSKNAPFEVNISNYDAPVMAVSKDGLQEVTAEGSGGNKINVQRKDKKNEVYKKFNLTVGEFVSFLDHINVAKEIFLNTYSAILMKEAIEADNENRKNAENAD